MYSTILARGYLTWRIQQAIVSSCTVNVYVVINFCDSVWYLWLEANLCQFFICSFVCLFVCLYLYCHWRSRNIRYQECQRLLDLINRFDAATLLSLSKSWNLDFHRHMSPFFLYSMIWEEFEDTKEAIRIRIYSC
jgi:hypothetical protein